MFPFLKSTKSGSRWMENREKSWFQTFSSDLGNLFKLFGEVWARISLQLSPGCAEDGLSYRQVGMGAAKVETCWREDGDQVLNLTLLGQFGVDFGTIVGSFRDMGRIMKVMKNLRFFCCCLLFCAACVAC